MAISLDRPVPLSKLDAVNLVLRARGQASTSILGSGAREAAIQAEETLAAESLAVQSENWSFLTEEALKLTPNTSGEIYTPENLIYMENADPTDSRKIVERGGRLYDRSTSSYVFEREVLLKATLALPFESLPQPARWYVALRASGENANQMYPSDNSMRATYEQISQARELLQQYDNRQRSHNLRETSGHFKRMRGNR